MSHRYEEVIDSVETAITSRLRDQLATARNAAEMFRIFSRFNALFVRPHIRSAIREYQTQLISRVKDDIDKLHEKFKVSSSHLNLLSPSRFTLSSYLLFLSLYSHLPLSSPFSLSPSPLLSPSFSHPLLLQSPSTLSLPSHLTLLSFNTLLLPSLSHHFTSSYHLCLTFLSPYPLTISL